MKNAEIKKKKKKTNKSKVYNNMRSMQKMAEYFSTNSPLKLRTSKDICLNGKQTTMHAIAYHICISIAGFCLYMHVTIAT